MDTGTEEEHYGCPYHPNAGYGYHPIHGNICVECGHRITLLKLTYTVKSAGGAANGLRG